MDKDFLLRKISRNSQIVSELKDSASWRMIREDFLDTKRRIDDTWAFVPVTEPEKLQELRVTRLAVDSIINLLGNYEHDLKTAQEQLAKADDPEALASINYGDK